MTGSITPYLVAFSAMLFAGLSALTLITCVNHFDPPETIAPPRPVENRAAA